MSTEPQLRMSPLCRKYEKDGKEVEIFVYAGDSEEWILEVVDGFGNSTVWDDAFDTDQAALDEVLRTIKDEGIESLIGPPENTEH